MASIVKSNGSLSVRAYIGDAKTLLAFNLKKSDARNLAGFTIQVQAGKLNPYYILNNLQFEKPADHAQDPTLPANSSFNAPLHKFRWLHVPGTAHQGPQPFFGEYVYTVSPRFFDASNSLLPLDNALSVAVKVNVAPFSGGALRLGFTRGFVQSQAFVRHFGRDALIRPKGKELLFDTSVKAGANAAGDEFTYRDEYEWSGFTAHDRIFETVQAVVDSKTLRLDMFAYDLNEPDLIPLLLKLAKQGRIRIILDNAALHHAKGTPTKAEDRFEALFTDAAKQGAEIKRGKFGRFSHDKVLVVKRGAGAATATKVLTGSTNFSITGLYVNSNHVIVFDDAEVAQEYAAVFEEAWNDDVKLAKFRKSSFATGAFSSSSSDLPRIEITFSPHDETEAGKVLERVAARIVEESKKPRTTGSVLFAVMEMDNGKSPVFQALESLHANTDIFSYGISDNPGGIFLYRPQARTGVLVTGKPGTTVLPPPFKQVPDIGLSHQVHHKFVVCGFRRKDAVVYCGSSNLASGGEALNGDNLIAIHDQVIATVFVIEAIALVDHFDFLDRMKSKAPKGKNPKPPVSKPQGALDVGWFLSTTDKWTQPYYDPNDLRSVDRQLFA
jgi:phosphatidylserine/phosphatidylglycerophosphate/cardiolipin synthase-like enzyme